MFVTLLKAKLHSASVTMADLHYEGSISIDEDLIEEAGFFLHEKVEIYNITNGNRFATYVIKGARGTGEIGLNGAAARQVMVGDQVIICAYGTYTPEEAAVHTPKVVLMDENNKPK